MFLVSKFIYIIEIRLKFLIYNSQTLKINEFNHFNPNTLTYFYVLNMF